MYYYYNSWTTPQVMTASGNKSPFKTTTKIPFKNNDMSQHIASDRHKKTQMIYWNYWVTEISWLCWKLWLPHYVFNSKGDSTSEVLLCVWQQSSTEWTELLAWNLSLYLSSVFVLMYIIFINTFSIFRMFWSSPNLHVLYRIINNLHWWCTLYIYTQSKNISDIDYFQFWIV